MLICLPLFGKRKNIHSLFFFYEALRPSQNLGTCAFFEGGEGPAQFAPHFRTASGKEVASNNSISLLALGRLENGRRSGALSCLFWGGSYHRRAPQMDCGQGGGELDKWEEGGGLLTHFSFCSDEEFRPRGQAGKQAGPKARTDALLGLIFFFLAEKRNLFLVLLSLSLRRPRPPPPLYVVPPPFTAWIGSAIKRMSASKGPKEFSGSFCSQFHCLCD